jgi:DNA-binding SARP family transcriptional activator/tetratricopeptide (TPR) repeat protein
MVPFRLTVLGPPELHAPDGDPVRFRTRKHFALLIYLAIEPPTAHRRDRLATLLWARADIDEARHSLATALSLLRGRIGAEAFDAGRDTVRLLPGLVVSDLSGLERDNPADPAAPDLGPFLDDFDIDDSPDFLHWKDGQRARLLPLLHSTLAERIEYSRRRGDSRTMEALAQRLLHVDDLSEEATRAQLEARAMAGDRIGALRLFDRWRARLADELGALPPPALTRMAERLRRNGWTRPAPAIVAPVPTESWKERIFIGRGAEFTACYNVWEQVRNGEPRHMLLRGETGIGKTTLVERFVTSVALEGAAVARVKCYELERELPFGVIGGLVNHLLELPGASATPPEQLAELGRLVAKVRQRYPSLPEPLPSAGESARLLFTEGVMALVAAVAEEHPVVLAIDDIHLADATSLAVLHLLLRRIDALPLMVLLTSSSALQSETPSARKFVDSADSIALTQLPLGPLPHDDATELLVAILAHGDDPGPTLRRAMLAGARGNPMVLELLVGDWRRRGDECLALSLGAMTSTARTPPAEAFRRLVDHMLAALDPESRAVAELGAILGQRLNDLSMYTLVDLPVARTMRAMTSLASHRILRDAGDTLEFANEFVRGQCYIGMAAPLRRMLHGSVADRLLAEDGADQPIPGLEIAWHLVRADRLGEAVPYLLAGGREAIRRAAPHEADLALSTGLPVLTGESRRTAILLLAEAQQELGRWADSLQLLDMAKEDFDESERCCREVYRIIARRWLGHLSMSNMVEATDDLFTIALKDIDIETRVKALAASVRLLTLTRHADHLIMLDGLVHCVAAFEMDAFQQLHLILVRGWSLAVHGHTSAALAEVTRGVDLADASSVASSIAVRLLVGKGCLLCMAGRYDEALGPLERAAVLADGLDNRTLRAECASQLALVEGRLGNADRQISWARQALSLFPDTEWCAWVIGATYELGLGLAAEERYSEAQAAVSTLFTKRAADVPLWLRQASLLCGADVVALSGHPRRAYTMARKATSGTLSKLGHAAYAGQFARWVALLAVRDELVQEARDRLEDTFPQPASLDCKDQAEVLAAMAILDSKLGADSSSAWREVQQRLSKLPVCVATVMRRLGTQAGAAGDSWSFR